MLVGVGVLFLQDLSPTSSFNCLNSTVAKVLACAASVVVLVSYIWFACLCPGKVECNAFHSIASPVVVLAFVILRNCTETLRSYHSAFFAHVGTVDHCCEVNLITHNADFTRTVPWPVSYVACIGHQRNFSSPTQVSAAQRTAMYRLVHVRCKSIIGCIQPAHEAAGAEDLGAGCPPCQGCLGGCLNPHRNQQAYCLKCH